MSNTTLYIDRSAQLFLVAPFWCTITTVGATPEGRPDFLHELKSALDRWDGQQDRWVLELFKSPRTLKRRKYGQLWRSVDFDPSFVDQVRLLVGNESFGGIFSRVIYIDYGICAMETAIEYNGLDSDSFDVFSERAEEVKLYLVSEFNAGMPHADFDLQSFDDAVKEFLVNHDVPTVANKLRPSYDPAIIPARSQFMCGPVSRNVLFTDTDTAEDQIKVEAEQLKLVALKFLNESNDNLGRTGSDKIPFSHEGFEGAVAVVRRSYSAGKRVLKERDQGLDFAAMCCEETGSIYRTKLLWSLVHVYWSALYSASEGYFAIASLYGSATKKSLRQIRKELDEMDEFQKIISMIKFEAQPEKVIVEGEDRIRYSNIWNAYDAEELLRALSQIQQDAAATIESLRDQAQKIIQRRTNRIIGAFTLLTLISVVVDVIVLYDVRGSLGPIERLSILGITTGSLFLLAGVAWLIASASKLTNN